ncbi:hypothetical protein [Candidatus Nitronereus thalassa]|uniref:Uncharacterized protein n=1 Tax=Candidatus Nitronereus thalassa TaxID=3020898 RepID=A0ABU3K9F8_9BACT|nr:hypothetical protein [Candidatus Nitronereus thalassa]MDT7043054.1 hypothetical protein [Candidatus Nitronereus thalassa]
MNLANSDQSFSSLPVKIIPTQEGAILKRGCTEVQIRGEQVGTIIKEIFSLSSRNKMTKVTLLSFFSPEVQSPVAKLIDQLVERRFLVSNASLDTDSGSTEGPADIFYWHFDQTQPAVQELLHTKKITILGVNYISRQLAISLRESGFSQVDVVDDPGLRNLRFFDTVQEISTSMWPSNLPLAIAMESWEALRDPSSQGCVVPTCDFGNPHALREWNAQCVQQNIHFFPIVLSNMIGQIGPFVIPQETACFECVLMRQHSHLANPPARQAVDEAAFDSQAVVGFHPSMASILGNIAAMELTKFYSQAMPLWNVGKLIEVNLLATRMTTRKVLKIPRCRVCSPLQTRSAITPDKPLSQFKFSKAQS